MKKLLLACALLLSVSSFGQEYRSTLGVKGGVGILGGYGVGLNYKQLIAREVAFETILTANSSFILSSNLFEYHKRINVSNFFWYAGGGIEAGMYFSNFSRNNRRYEKKDYNFGVTAIGGIEYVFKDFPMNICIDFKPSFRFDKHLIRQKKVTGWYDVFIGVRFNLSKY